MASDMDIARQAAAVGAEIIAGAASPEFRTVTIDKGTSDRLQTDMAVLSPSGVVGRVILPSRRASKVQLLIDRNAAAGAVVERSRAQGVVVGSGTDRLRMEYVPGTADVKEGDEGVGPIAGDEIHACFETASGIPLYDTTKNVGTAASGFGIQIFCRDALVDLRMDEDPLIHVRAGNPFVPTRSPQPWVPFTSGGLGAPEPVADIRGLVLGHRGPPDVRPRVAGTALRRAGRARHDRDDSGGIRDAVGRRTR